MEDKIAIKISGLSKVYSISGKKMGVSFAERLLDFFKLSKRKKEKDDFYALKNINLEIIKGESIGLIGRNGAGKSTLLKILSEVVEPTEGTIEINGTIASVLEVGMGFHPELTGRENVYLSATMLGISKNVVNSKFDEIVKFSGVEKFIDTPIKHYSSGMYLRLAFSVVANIDADILLFDEVLNVGDIDFQKQCVVKIRELLDNQKTIVLVSHNTNDIIKLCDNVILIENGEIVSYGKPNITIVNYLDVILDSINDIHYTNSNSKLIDEINIKCKHFNIQVKSIKVYPFSEPNREILYWDDELAFQIIFDKTKIDPAVAFGYNFFHHDNIFLSVNSLDAINKTILVAEEGFFQLETIFSKGFFNSTRYTIDLFITDKSGENTVQIKNILCFSIEEKQAQNLHQIFVKHNTFLGPMKTRSNWQLKNI